MTQSLEGLIQMLSIDYHEATDELPSMFRNLDNTSQSRYEMGWMGKFLLERRDQKNTKSPLQQEWWQIKEQC